MKKLTDKQYIWWSQKEEWSLTQAVYLLHGKPPPDSEETVEQLRGEFPVSKRQIKISEEQIKTQQKHIKKLEGKISESTKQVEIEKLEKQIKKVHEQLENLLENLHEYIKQSSAEKMLQSHNEWVDQTEKLEVQIKQTSVKSREEASLLQISLAHHKESYPKRPEVWIGRASLNGIEITDSWIAIFPMSMSDVLGYLTDDEPVYTDDGPDFREFIKVLTCDTPTTLSELAGYVLNVNEPEKLTPPDDYNNFLRDMNLALNLNKDMRDELPNQFVSPRTCMQSCRIEHYSSDSQCLHWVSWLDKHPDLAIWLNTQKSAQQTEVDYLLINYLNETNYKGGSPGLMRYMRDVVGAKYIEGDKWVWTNPVGTPIKKSHGRLKNRLSELKKERQHL